MLFGIYYICFFRKYPIYLCRDHGSPENIGISSERGVGEGFGHDRRMLFHVKHASNWHESCVFKRLARILRVLEHRVSRETRGKRHSANAVSRETQNKRQAASGKRQAASGKRRFTWNTMPVLKRCSGTRCSGTRNIVSEQAWCSRTQGIRHETRSKRQASLGVQRIRGIGKKHANSWNTQEACQFVEHYVPSIMRHSTNSAEHARSMPIRVGKTRTTSVERRATRHARNVPIR